MRFHTRAAAAVATLPLALGSPLAVANRRTSPPATCRPHHRRPRSAERRVGMLMTMNEFNQPVTIKAPPASKVVTG